MTASRRIRWLAQWMGAAAAVAAATYGVYAAVAWRRYGHVAPPSHADEADLLLDRVMPAYDVVERHRVHVDAPRAITFEAAATMDLFQSPPIRAIFHAREWI